MNKDFKLIENLWWSIFVALTWIINILLRHLQINDNLILSVVTLSIVKRIV